MSMLEQLLAEDPPRELFHYTSQEGLLGIARKREIWASKALFLNDAAEYQLALDMARGEVVTRSLGEDSEEDLLEDIDDISHANVFVGSFSAEGDLLSQWRGYCPSGSGFSLAFAGKDLQHAADHSQVFYLGRCTYDPEVHEAVIKELVDHAVACRASMGAPSPGPQRPHPSGHPVWSKSFKGALAFAAPLLKHPSFAEEREWRLVSLPVSHSHERFDFRPGKSTIVPFFRFPLATHAGPIPLRRVIVGPTPHPRLAINALSHLLTDALDSGVSIENSEIPFRSW